MSRMINADELELDAAWDDYEDGYTAYSQRQIEDASSTNALVLTEDEAQLLLQCLSNHFYSIGGLPETVASCANKLLEYVAELEESKASEV